MSQYAAGSEESYVPLRLRTLYLAFFHCFIKKIYIYIYTYRKTYRYYWEARYLAAGEPNILHISIVSLYVLYMTVWKRWSGVKNTKNPIPDVFLEASFFFCFHFFTLWNTYLPRYLSTDVILYSFIDEEEQKKFTMQKRISNKPWTFAGLTR